MSLVHHRRSAAIGLGALAGALALAACSGAAAPSSDKSPSAPTSAFTVLTPPPSSTAGDLTWATYRETQTLDPIQAFDYPENTVDPLLCDSLLRQNPDMTVSDGLAKVSNPSPTEFRFTLNADATFWDGTPVTAQDAVFSLQRAADPKAGGYYADTFDRVKAFTVTGDKTFTITMKQPDYWLLGELSATPGEVLQKKYVEAKGKAFGTVSGGTMCSGPFKLASWKTGQGVKMVPNPDYWDKSLPVPKLKSLTVIGVPDDATLTAGLKTGAISGSYPIALSTLGQLEQDPSVKVYQGAPFSSSALVISATKGPLANPTVRQAISYALDREGLISAAYKGAGVIPHALAPSGTWGYSRDVFAKGYDALPPLTRDLTKAKQLAQEAGVAGQTITIGTASGVPVLNTETLAVKAAAEAIGLKVTLKNVSPANYINFFIDPKAWGSVDAFATTNYGDYGDPAALYATLSLPTGTQNFNQWNNPKVIADLEAARSEPDLTKRAEDVVAAQKIITEQQAWIPLVAPNNVVIMNKSVTGAPATFSYMFGPWAAHLGGN